MISIAFLHVCVLKLERVCLTCRKTVLSKPYCAGNMAVFVAPQNVSRGFLKNLGVQI
jgi:hypothetical protein